ncbi:MAG: hypothetical protein M3430_20670, partial [Acidobacteriota bacterium]|nr:hypothetical protein [Acidobacteriota bacterium]
MKPNGKGNGNGHEGDWPAGVTTGTYQSIAGQGETKKAVADDDEIVFDSDEMGSAADDPDTRQRRRRRRRRIAGVLVLLLFVAAVGGAAAYYLIRRSMKLDVIVGNGRANTPAPHGEVAGSGNNLTQQALREMREATKNTGRSDGPTSPVAGEAETPSVASAAPADVPPNSTGPATEKTLDTTVLPEGLAGTIRTSPQAGYGTERGIGTGIRAEAKTDSEATDSRSETMRSTAGESPVRATNASTSRRNQERAIRMIPAGETKAFDAKSAAPNPPTRQPSEKQIRRTDDVARQIDEGVVAVPNFGTMLPVRTLGAIYTLRSSSLARFELTRDVSGEGWGLKRGTVFVGMLRGGEYDRAYMTVIGFIDPDTRRLVKVGGEVLGSDGGNGLRGKRRQLSSRLSRLLGEAGRGAVSLAQSALSGRNGGATIIMPGVQGTVQPELAALGGRGTNGREFVEVAAGAPAYVLINDLPETIKGVDAANESGRERTARELVAGEGNDGTV